jgi:hypothetical protein
LGVEQLSQPEGDVDARGFVAADSKAMETNTRRIESNARTLALAAMLDLGLFFGVLLVGFAYVWKRGDLDWVRAMRYPTASPELASTPAPFAE